MDEAEKTRRREKARRQSIYFKDGQLQPPKSLEKRTICNVHLILANEIDSLPIDDGLKKSMLSLVDEVYRMGKRMDNALDIYRAEKAE